MVPVVYIQPVQTEVELDRRLHRGDELIVECRQQARVGEWIVAEAENGACVGLYSDGAELQLHPLETSSGCVTLPRQDVRVRGIVIGMRSAL
jgi:SOS-response transcriptional repressor LexA